METSEDKQWASKYLLDPLTAPEPSQETGPGSHYGSTFARAEHPTEQTDSQSKAGKEATVSIKPILSHRSGLADGHQRSSSLGRPSTEVPTSSNRVSLEGGRARGSSLGARYPGDESHRPLDIIRRDSKKANRAPHLRKKQHIGVDQIDRLDAVGQEAYHHGSAYDAASLARNQNPRDGPLYAVAGTNQEALRATPREKVIDSLKHHRPLDGVAMTPPGRAGPNGRVMRYEEGTDLMIENGGNYKRWPGIDYRPDDLKGQGEPAFSIQKALKDHDRATHSRHGSNGVELVDHPNHNGSSVGASTGAAAANANGQEPVGAQGTSSGRIHGPHLPSHRRRHNGSDS